jgi:hypothetical protein
VIPNLEGDDAASVWRLATTPAEIAVSRVLSGLANGNRRHVQYVDKHAVFGAPFVHRLTHQDFLSMMQRSLVAEVSVAALTRTYLNNGRITRPMLR